MEIKIEKATIEDLDRLQKIERECFNEEAFSRERLAYLLETPNATDLKAKRNNKIVGFIIGLIKNRGMARIGQIFTLDVATEHRRTGIGFRLLNELERVFLENNVKTVYLEVRVDNEVALELYHKKGYFEIEPLQNYYSRGVHGFRMKKEF